MYSIFKLYSTNQKKMKLKGIKYLIIQNILGKQY